MKPPRLPAHCTPVVSHLSGLLLLGVALLLGGGAKAAVVPLIPAHSVWKYSDIGVDLGTAWRAPLFDDSAWARGPGVLGYGQGNEATMVSWGPNSSAKYITTYFRHSFIVTNTAGVSALSLNLLRDDGAVVYLNGVEVARDNLPAGPVAFATVAVGAVGGADETNYFPHSLGASLLVNGVNVVAVEVHQNSPVSADLSFDLELLGDGSGGSTNAPPAVSFLSPTNHAQFPAGWNIPLIAQAHDPDGDMTIRMVEFFAGTNRLGLRTNSLPGNTNLFSFLWTNVPAGDYSLTATVADDHGARGVSLPVQISVTNQSVGPVLVVGWLKREIYTNIPGITIADLTNSAGFPGHPDLVNWVEAFEAPSQFADNYGQRLSGWLLPPETGDYVFYLSSDDQSVLFLSRDESPANLVAIAHEDTWTPSRTWTGFGTRTNAASISGPIRLEAGRQYYVEALMKEGGGGDSLGVAWKLPGGAEPVDGSPPIPGDYLAVLDNWTLTNRLPAVRLVTPTNGAVFASPANVLLVAHASDQDGRIAQVEFFAGTNRLGVRTNLVAAATNVVSLSWSNPPVGQHTLTARATDDRGGTGLSTPVVITVMASPPLASVRQVWEHRFNGPGNYDDWPTGITTDLAGRAYVMGAESDTPYLNFNALLFKFGAGSTPLWMARHNAATNNYDFPRALTTDAAGNVYMAGESVMDGPQYDMFVVKYGPDGNRLWVWTYDGAAHKNDYVTGLHVDAAGNAYVGGHTEWYSPDSEYFALKLDATGRGVWTNRYVPATNGWHYPTAMASDADDNVYLTGRATGADGRDEYATVKFGRNGDRLWAARYSGPRRKGDYASTIAADGAGNVLVSGGSYDNDMDQAIATVKYDSSGRQVWAARFKGNLPGYHDAFALKVDRAGNAFISAGIPTEFLAPGGYSKQFATLKYSPDGRLAWFARYNGQAWQADFSSDLALDAAGNVYVSGTARDGGATNDLVTIRYAANGSLVWLARYDGPAHLSDSQPLLAVNAAGDVFVTGRSQGAGSGLDVVTIQYAQANAPGAPVITVPPMGQVVLAGSSVTLTVTATGADLQYRWRKFGDPIPGATNATLVLPNIQASADYSVELRNAAGWTISPEAQVVVGTPPWVMVYPSFQRVLVSADVTLTSAVGGTPPFQLQWFRDGVALPGATDRTLLVSNIQSHQAGAYVLCATNVVGFAASGEARVVVSLTKDGPGTLDLSFADPNLAAGRDDVAEVIALLECPAGNVLAGGWFESAGGLPHNGLVRVRSNGAVDETFATDVGAGRPAVVQSMVRQPDGGVILGGYYGDDAPPLPSCLLLRLTPDGRLDPDFPASLPATLTNVIQVRCLAVFADGGFVAAVHGYTPGHSATWLLRYDSHGRRETNYFVLVEGGYGVQAMAALPDGKLVIAGEFSLINGVSSPESVARLNPDGTLDTAFAPSLGLVELYVLAVQKDGRVLVGGYVGFADGPAGLVRLSEDGSIEMNFAPRLEGIPTALALESDGQILAAGSFDTVNGEFCPGLSRLNPDGTLDATFDPWGGVETGSVEAILVQSNGQIVIGGAFTMIDGQPRHGIARLQGDPVVPVITVQPVSQAKLAGQSALFSVQATGTPPLHYQWQKGGVNLAGATNATLALPAVSSADAGDYCALVSNVAGSVRSQTATLVVWAGPTLIGARDDQQSPAVAGDGTNFLVVWLDRRHHVNDDWTRCDIYGARIAADGRLLDPNGLLIASNSFWGSPPALGFDGVNYLVVWQHNPDGHPSSLFATRVSPGGVVLDPNGFRVSAGAGSQGKAALAFNGGAGLVVWIEYHDDHRDFAVCGARVTAAGAILDSAGFFLYHGSSWPSQVTVASLERQWLAVWGDGASVWGASVTSEGVPDAPHRITTSPQAGWVESPALAALGTNYLLAWAGGHYITNDVYLMDIGGTLLNRGGYPIATQMIALNTNRALGSYANVTGYKQEHPCVAASGRDFLVAWEAGNIYTNGGDQAWRSDIRAARVSATGLPSPVFAVCAAPQNQSRPAVAFAGERFLTAWQDARTAPPEDYSARGSFDIYAARVTTADRVLETNGFLVSATFPQEPVITWPVPADLVYGSRLSSVQLNAAADVPGSFVYAPPAGTLLEAGEHFLSVTFTPQDQTSYSTVHRSVPLTVTPAPLILRADDQARMQGLPNPPLTATATGFVNGDTLASLDTPVTLTTTAALDSPPGRYPIIASGASDANYTITHVNGTLTVLAAHNAPGTVDQGFDARVALTPGHYYNGVTALAVQPDGRILVGGFFTNIGGLERRNLGRLMPAGLGDATFQFRPGFVYPQAILVQPDGKILVGGTATGSGVVFPPLLRRNPDGSTDAGFRFVTSPTNSSRVTAMALQPDGRIVLNQVVCCGPDGNGSNIVLRVHPDGSRDTSFQPLLIYQLDDDCVNSIALQPDGKIIIAGYLLAYGQDMPRHVVRLQADGCVDPTFWPEVNSMVRTVAVQRDGRILIGGWFTEVNGEPRTGLARLNSDGSLDTGFQPLPWDEHRVEITVLALQADDRALVGGHHFDPQDSLDTDQTFLVRLNTDGGFDAGFQPAEFHHTILPGGQAYLMALTLQPDGHVLVGGSFDRVNGVPRTHLVRLMGNPLPPSFVRRHIASPTVQLVATPPAGSSVYAVEDQPPPGWMVQTISHGGVFDAATGKVKFGPFFDAEPRTLSYVVVMPPDWPPTAGYFAGQAAVDGLNTPILGDDRIVLPYPHPADIGPEDWSLSIDEVTAYGAAWRRGEAWSRPPHPIPIDYVTRAAALWRGGECYLLEPTVNSAPLWWVSCEIDTGRAPARMAGSVPSLATASTVTRCAPAVYVPGEPLPVSIVVTPMAGVLGHAVEETLPPGCPISAISDGGAFDTVNGVLRWGPFFDDQPRTLGYELLPAAGVGGRLDLGGIGSFDGSSQRTAGVESLSPGCRVTVTTRPDATGLHVRVRGELGRSYLVEVSSDLVNWSPVGTIHNSGPASELVDSEASGHPARFYRLRLLDSP
jgi:uncharacterized delta-60 repeat protein